MQLYYAHDIRDDLAFTYEVESKHMSRVIRLHVGDLAHVTDGLGKIWHAEILKLARSGATLKLLKIVQNNQPSTRLAIAVVPTKQASRIEGLVEKGVELGLTDLYLIRSSRMERKHLKTDRLERLAIAAMKQCLSTFRCRIHEIQDFESLLNIEAKSFKNKFIGKIDETPAHLINQDCKEDTMVVIGPEGDFTNEEFSLASQNGFANITLGKRRLRTETAGLMAIATIQNKRQLYV